MNYPVSYPYTPFPGAYLEPVVFSPAVSTKMTLNEAPFGAAVYPMTYPGTYPASQPYSPQVENPALPAIVQQTPTVIDFTGHSIQDYFSYNIPVDTYSVAYQMAQGVGSDVSGFLTPAQYQSAFVANHTPQPGAVVPNDPTSYVQNQNAASSVISFTGYSIDDYFQYNIPPDIYGVALEMAAGLGVDPGGFMTADAYAQNYAANHPELAGAEGGVHSGKTNIGVLAALAAGAWWLFGRK